MSWFEESFPIAIGAGIGSGIGIWLVIGEKLKTIPAKTFVMGYSATILFIAALCLLPVINAILAKWSSQILIGIAGFSSLLVAVSNGVFHHIPVVRKHILQWEFTERS